MKWAIALFSSNIDAKFTDGQPVIKFSREGLWQTWRLSTPLGFLDFTQSEKGLHLNDQFFLFSNDLLNLKLAIDDMGKFTAQVGDLTISGSLKPQPTIDQSYVSTFNKMYESKLVPYPKIPDAQGKSIEEIQALAKQYFPHRPESFLLALAIYDWTTADFDRMVLFTQFRHTAIDDRPIDFEGLTDAIWTSNWPPYTPKDEYFMGSFLMKPAKSREEVASQLTQVAETLCEDAKAETRLLTTALQCLPPTATKLKPRLFSGQVDIGNLTTAHFAPGFFEFPLNDSATADLKGDLLLALTDMLSKGRTITSKKVMSFTDTVDDAMHYQNGILLIAEPSEDDLTWETCAYVTPLSDGPTKTEYVFPAGAKFLIRNVEHQIINKKDMLVITLRPVGCLDPDLVASEKAIPVASGLKIETKLYPDLKPALSAAPAAVLFNPSPKKKPPQTQPSQLSIDCCAPSCCSLL